MDVRIVNSIEEAYGLGVPEQTLSPFYQREWLRGYEAAGLGGARAFYFCVDEGSGLAVVPAYEVVDGDPLGGVQLAPGTLMSHAWHCYQSVIPGREKGAVLAAVLAATKEIGRGFCLCNVDGDTHSCCMAAAPDQTRPMQPRYAIDLNRYANLEELIADRTRNLRSSFWRHMKKAKAGGVQFVAKPMRDADIEPIARICAVLAARHGTPWYYELERFSKLLNHLKADESCITFTLSVGDSILAASVAFEVSGCLHLWAGGAAADASCTHFSASTALLGFELRSAFELGCRRVEAGRSNGDYKCRFGFQPVPLNAYYWDFDGAVRPLAANGGP